MTEEQTDPSSTAAPAAMVSLDKTDRPRGPRPVLPPARATVSSTASPVAAAREPRAAALVSSTLAGLGDAGRRLTSRVQPDRSSGSASTAAAPSSRPGDYDDVRSHRRPVLVAAAIAVLSALTAAGLVLGGGVSAVVLLPVFVMLVAAFVVIWLGGRSSEVRIDQGTLVVRLGDLRRTFDLTDDATAIEVRGEPTGAADDWAMVLGRSALGPIEIDRRVVDPVTFTQAVGHWRADVLEMPVAVERP